MRVKSNSGNLVSEMKKNEMGHEEWIKEEIFIFYIDDGEFYYCRYNRIVVQTKLNAVGDGLLKIYSIVFWVGYSLFYFDYSWFQAVKSKICAHFACNLGAESWPLAEGGEVRASSKDQFEGENFFIRYPRARFSAKFVRFVTPSGFLVH